ncbi:Inner membrane transport protein YajR [hydrothermal vent metagenome]|uniref:Inner membrane transport protein YajR n=1 Tax=hydrothermal vent metagenome TaxID=652676 RepID=A0A3B1AD53_9ZZZZ
MTQSSTSESTHKTTTDDAMLPTERRAVFSLAGIYALRMMGLFMILPVFALYAETLEGYTPALIGLAIGIYGLTQAALQIPFGMASDRFGRKPVIILGLIIFAIGSVVAATADTMNGVIFGRALQGAGAIAAAVMALVADLTREEKRLGAMAIIGMSIGVAFAVSLVMGPLFSNWIGVDGIFWLTAVLALVAIAVLHFVVPNPVRSVLHRDAQTVPAQLKNVIRDPQLLRLNFGIMILHMMLTATFVVLPLALRDHAGLVAEQHWYIYLPVMVFAMLLMVPFIIIAEKKRRMKTVFTASVLVLGIGQLIFMFGYNSITSIVLGLFIFFTAFNVLEASLPSLVAKMVSPDNKGTAMGMYSSSQFLGAFFGGVLGGWLYGAMGFEAVFGLCAGMAAVWFLVAATMQSPRYLSSHLVRVGPISEERARHLVGEFTRVTGVAEAVVIAEDGVAYLKVDLHALDREALKAFSANDEFVDKAEKQGS